MDQRLRNPVNCLQRGKPRHLENGRIDVDDVMEGRLRGRPDLHAHGLRCNCKGVAGPAGGRPPASSVERGHRNLKQPR